MKPPFQPTFTAAFMAPLAALLLAVSAAPAAAWDLSYGGEMRFGVIYESGRDSGESRMRPGAGAVLNMQLSRQFDNGIRLVLDLGVEASNLDRPRPPWPHGQANPRE
ncbi:MAG: hypothetical protein JJT95_18630 [Pararhodobacter sp.]|nr:hypothetical protein [Pararhodobacter sp.]